MTVPLDDNRIKDLTELIKNSFRVQPNEDPVYVDVSGNLERIRANQHQVVFGRRGSGKSCLLVHFHRKIAQGDNIFSIYIQADELKRMGYPDALIRLLLRITEEVAGATQGWWAKRLGIKKSPLWDQAKALRDLLALAEEADVTQEKNRTDAVSGEAGVNAGRASAKFGASTSTSEGLTSSYKAEKLESLERHFPDFKTTLEEEFANTKYQAAAVIVDDFYLFHRDIQADVLDYLHRLLRGTNLYLKLGTVRHRTTLSRTNGQEIGVQLGEDVEEINLDRTFEHVEETREFLELMLDSLAQSVGIKNAAEFMSADGLLHLALASGGVPRDYLNTLVESVPAARKLGQSRVTPRTIYKGAGRLAYRGKLTHLRTDAGDDSGQIERVFTDLATFCLKEERKSGFLIAQDEVMTHAEEHEIIQQLMDFKLIHIIEPDTSAASGRAGRFEAYTLDFSLFMEPRLRGIKHIEFWKTDQQRRREGVREAPHHQLARASGAAAGDGTGNTEVALEDLQAEIGTDEADLNPDDPEATLF